MKKIMIALLFLAVMFVGCSSDGDTKCGDCTHHKTVMDVKLYADNGTVIAEYDDVYYYSYGSSYIKVYLKSGSEIRTAILMGTIQVIERNVTQ